MPAPKFNPQPPISAPQVKELKEALEIMLPGPLGLSEAPFRNKYKRWDSPMKLSKEVLEWTQQDDVKDAYYVLTQWQETYSNPPEYESPTMTPAPEQIASNIPQKGIREVQEAELERRNADIKASVEKAKAQTQAEITRRQEYAKQRQIIRDQVTKTRIAQTELQGRKVSVRVEIPKDPILSQNEQTAYTRLKELSQKNPIQTKEELSAAIQEKIPVSIKQSSTPEEVKLYADTVATQAVANLRMASPPPPDVETAILVTAATDKNVLQKVVSKPDTQKILSQGLNDLARLRMTAYQAPASALDMIVGPNVRKLILGPSPAEIHASFQTQGATHELDFGKLNSNYQSTLQNPMFSYAQGEIKGKVLDYGKQQLLSRLSSFPPDSALGKLAASNQFQSALTMLQPYTSFEFVGAEGLPGIFGKFIMQFSPESAPLLSGFGNMLGIDFGIAPISSAVTPIAADALTVGIGGEVAATGGGLVAGEIAGTTAGVVAGEAAGVAVGTAAGTAAGATAGAVAGTAIPIPIIGTIIGAVVGAVTAALPKITNWIKDKLGNVGNYLIAGLGVGIGAAIGAATGVGALLGGLVGGGIGYLGAGAFTGGLPAVGASLSGAASATAGAFGVIWSTFMAGVGTPILAILIGFPVLVVFILIIINSGAYMVPPGAALINSTNPYLDVQKVASPNGQLDVPQTITYTITVTAKKDTLTGVSFQYDCNAIKKDGTKINCKGLEEVPPAPVSIEPSTPFTFTFTSDYTDTYDFSDSLVTDTFTVNATSPSGGKVSQTGSASICFGDCPLNCFDFSDPSWSQMPDLQSMLTEAAGTLVGTYPDFAAKVCPAGGPVVKICYTTSDPAPDSGIFARYVNDPGGCTFNFNKDVEPYGSEGVLFLLTHEVTHHIQNINSGYFNKYKDVVNPPTNEDFICTRDLDTPEESMAEGNALFVAAPVIDANQACLTSSFQSQYPLHYDFAKNVMFAP